jgi:hypothetical protein
MAFLRSAGAEVDGLEYTCRRWSAPGRRRAQPPSNICEMMLHGDLIQGPDDFRSADVWVVYGDERKHCVTIDDSAGHGRIPVFVTAQIEDPVNFYKDQMGITVSTIELSPGAHQSLLQKLTGGRPVHPSRQVTCTEEGFFIQKPLSADLTRPGVERLDEFCPVEYLQNNEYLQKDPYVERRRDLNRELHAPNLPQRLAPGSKVALTSIKGSETLGGSRSISGGTVVAVTAEVIDVQKGSGTSSFTCRSVGFQTGQFGNLEVWTDGKWILDLLDGQHGLAQGPEWEY